MKRNIEKEKSLVREMLAKRAEKGKKLNIKLEPQEIFPDRKKRSHPFIEARKISTFGKLGIREKVNQVISISDIAALDSIGESFAISDGLAGVETAKENNIAMPRLLEPRTSSTGPWCYPNFKKIQVLISQLYASWFFNDFFDTVSQEDKQIYLQYYQPGENLPTNSSGYVGDSSNFGALEGSGGTLLSLQCIQLTSLYGGSVRLRFTLDENYGTEIGSGIESGNDVWDLWNLTMDIYVNLKPGTRGFNANSNMSARKYDGSRADIHIELIPVLRAAYTIDEEGDISRLTKEEDVKDSESRLSDYISSFCKDLAASVRGTLPRAVTAATRDTLKYLVEQFVFGFLHTQLQSRFLDENTRVEAIQITDNYINLFTSQAQYTFSVRVRAEHLTMDTEIGDEEPIVAISATHTFNGGWDPIPGKTYHLNIDEDLNPFNKPGTTQTPWYYIGNWNVSDIRKINGQTGRGLDIVTQVALSEDNPRYRDQFVPRGHEYNDIWPHLWVQEWQVKLYPEESFITGLSVEEEAIADNLGILKEEKISVWWNQINGIWDSSSASMRFVFQVLLSYG